MLKEFEIPDECRVCNKNQSDALMCDILIEKFPANIPSEISSKLRCSRYVYAGLSGGRYVSRPKDFNAVDYSKIPIKAKRIGKTVLKPPYSEKM